MKTFILSASIAALLITPSIAQDSAQALQDAFVTAVIAEDADALAGLYAEDATSYPPDGTVAIGHAAIAASWRASFDAFDGFTLELNQQGEHDMGKSHAAWGVWTMTATPVDGGEATVWNGRYADVAIKTKDGWRYIVDHASLSAPIEETSTEE